MTLEEKASQLRYNAPAIERLGIPAYNWWNEVLHDVARAGTATVFPQAIALAAMFDEELQESIAETIANEARAKYNGQSRHGDRDIYKGLTVWSPNINIFRDPRWGRGHETYGEDPFLTSRLGVRFIRGLQGKGKYLKVAACSKHFAVHSGPESLRHEFDAIVNANYEVSRAWRIKEDFRDIIKGKLDRAEAFTLYMMWRQRALAANIPEITKVIEMFDRHQKGIINALCMGRNNGKAERMNGSIQELQTVGRGYRDVERFRIAILFFYGGLTLHKDFLVLKTLS